eukprot:3811795-Rhodomonas_salina.1
MQAINDALPRQLFLFFQHHAQDHEPVEIRVKHKIKPSENRMLVLHREGEGAWSTAKHYKAFIKIKNVPAILKDFNLIKLTANEMTAVLAHFHKQHWDEGCSITHSHMSILQYHHAENLRYLVHRTDTEKDGVKVP